MGKPLDYNSDIPPATQLARMGQAALRERTKRGLHVGPAPIGYVYRHDPELGPVLEIDPVKGPWVAKVFELKKEGKSIRQILKIMKLLGLRSQQGNSVGISSIHRILNSPIYNGKIAAGGVEWLGVHQSLDKR